MQVQAHRARKRRRIDPNSPMLDFEEKDLLTLAREDARKLRRGPTPREWASIACEISPREPRQDPEPTFRDLPVETYPAATIDGSDLPEKLPERGRDSSTAVVRPPLPPFPRISAPVPKIIEFPRAAAAQYELAEPVADQLTIFEAVEELPAPPPNHLSQIEIAPEEPAHRAVELEVPIQAAPLSQRSYAAAVDFAIMIAAMALFAMCADLFASSLPPMKPLLASGTVAGLLLLSGYYWLSFSFRRSTPGMDASGLRIVTFAGQTPSRTILRWRAIATVLSYAALGMGVSWSVIDEDRLCWHDRITHTYLASK